MIKPLDKVKNKISKEDTLLALFFRDIESFGKFFFSHHLKSDTPDFHRSIYSIYESDNRFVGIGAPRGHAKSTITDLVFLAWCICTGRTRFVLLVSDTYSQATMFLDTLKAEFESNERLKAFYGNRVGKTWTEGEIVAGDTMVKALGAGMKVRGLKYRDTRPDLIIIDDLENDELVESRDRREKLERWFGGALIPSLDKNGRVIMIGTILHYDSMMAKILSQDKYTNFQKKTYRAIKEDGTALWESHLNLQEIENIKAEYIRNGQASLFYSEYMNDPVDKETQEFKRENFKYRTREAVDSLLATRILTIDTAISQRASADYTGIVENTIDREGFWNIRAWHKRMNPMELIDDLFALQSLRHYAKIGIEKTIYLQAVKPFLDAEMRKRGTFLPVVELEHNQTAKETRIRALLPYYNSGTVFHVEGECSDLEEEMLTFPKGIHDDILDALAYHVQISSDCGLILKRPTYTNTNKAIR